MGKLPLLDLLDPGQAAGLELFSFIDDTPWCPARDARAAHECAKLHDDRLAPFIGTMAKQISATFGSGNFASFPASQRNVTTSPTPAATIKIDTHVLRCQLTTTTQKPPDSSTATISTMLTNRLARQDPILQILLLRHHNLGHRTLLPHHALRQLASRRLECFGSS